MSRENLLIDLSIVAVLCLVAAGLLYLRERIAYKSGPAPAANEVVMAQQPPSELIGRWELSSENPTFFSTLEIRPDGIYRFLDRRGNLVRAGRYFVNGEHWVIFQARETLAEQRIPVDIIYDRELEFIVSSSPRQLALFYSGTGPHGEPIQEVWKFFGKDIAVGK